MLHDLDETLRQLLIRMGGLDPAEVDISFDIPTRDWSTPVTRPTVNLYLFDIRENRTLRETDWDEEPQGDGKVVTRRVPVRVDVSYMITCWTSAPEDQHRLLWRVLETLFRYSPLPDEILQGDVRHALHAVRTEVAQPDGILRNVSDFWGALENQLRPAINLNVTLDLDLQQLTTTPLVFARVVKLGRPGDLGEGDDTRALTPGWEVGPLRVAGEVHDSAGKPVQGAAVRLVGVRDGQPVQVGPTTQTQPDGRYVLEHVAPGRYTLVLEAPGHPPRQYPLLLAAPERGVAPPVLVHQLEVPMPEG